MGKTPIITNRKDSKYIIPLTTSPHLFIGEKPVAVLFGDKRVAVKTWREVYMVILTHCNRDAELHKTLMYLRGKLMGKCRVFLSDGLERMTRPIKIAEELYGETHYGAQTLIHILVNRILIPVGFDCYSVNLVLKGERKSGVAKFETITL